MYDQPLFLQTLSRFAAVLPARYDLEAVLTELTESATAVLGLWGSGVTMADDDRLRYVTAEIQASGELERNQEWQQAGPCRDAYETGEVVRVSDVREESARWPEFAATSTRRGVAGVAGIPMRLADKIIGTLNLYSAGPREWSDKDIAVAGVLAHVATSYVVNASMLRQQEQLSEQLQHALESRVVIEQAKGITAFKNAVTVDQAYRLIRRHARNNPSRPQQQRQPTDGSRGDRCRGASGLSPAAVRPDLVFPTDHPHLVHRTRLPAPHRRRHCSPVLGGNTVGKRNEPSKTRRTGDQRLSSVARPSVTASGTVYGAAQGANEGVSDHRNGIPERHSGDLPWGCQPSFQPAIRPPPVSTHR